MVVGRAAAALTWWPDLNVGVVDASRRPGLPAQPGYRWNQRSIPAHRIVEVSGVPVSDPALTVLDLIPTLGGKVIDEALRRRAVTLDDLRQALSDTPGRRGNRRRAWPDRRLPGPALVGGGARIPSHRPRAPAAVELPHQRQGGRGPSDRLLRSGAARTAAGLRGGRVIRHSVGRGARDPPVEPRRHDWIGASAKESRSHPGPHGARCRGGRSRTGSRARRSRRRRRGGSRPGCHPWPRS